MPYCVCVMSLYLPSSSDGGGKGVNRLCGSCKSVQAPPFITKFSSFLALHMVTSILLFSETMTILLGLLFIVILRVEGCLNFNV